MKTTLIKQVTANRRNGLEKHNNLCKNFSNTVEERIAILLNIKKMSKDIYQIVW